MAKIKYTELAKYAPACFGCGDHNDGTVVCAHRSRGGWGLRFGRGIKSVDTFSAFLCQRCHNYGDGEGRRDSDWWELAIGRTLTWTFQYLKVNYED